MFDDKPWPASDDVCRSHERAGWCVFVTFTEYVCVCVCACMCLCMFFVTKQTFRYISNAAPARNTWQLSTQQKTHYCRSALTTVWPMATKSEWLPLLLLYEFSSIVHILKVAAGWEAKHNFSPFRVAIYRVGSTLLIWKKKTKKKQQICWFETCWHRPDAVWI
jgi:hypothetical protein